MNARSKFALFVAAVAIWAPGVVLAQSVAPAAEWNGTWKLDTAGSKFAAPAGKRSETRTYKIDGNKVSVKSTGTDAEGKAEGFSYSAAFDGKWYPITGSQFGDSISLTLVNPRQSKAEVRKGNKSTLTATLTIADDGKGLTLDRKTLGANGSPTTDVFVFNRAR